MMTATTPQPLDCITPWLFEVRCASSSGPYEAPALDVAAAALDVKVSYGDLAPTLSGITWDGSHVVLNRTLPPSEMRFALAHELAHVGIARQWIFPQGDDEEWISDWFAREVLLPVTVLATMGKLPEALADEAALMAVSMSWAVPRPVVLLQAARLGYLPSVQTYEGLTLCTRCGDRTRLPGCPCVTTALHVSRTPLTTISGP